MPRVRRPKEKRFNARYTVPTVKHSPSVIGWGAISAEGRGPLFIIPNGMTITAKVYLNIMKEKFPGWLQRRNCTVPCNEVRTK